jgi:hypothetical protein
MSDHPFDNRETRIRRREERNMFRRNLLPVAWALSVIGFGGLSILAGYFFFKANGFTNMRVCRLPWLSCLLF